MNKIKKATRAAAVAALVGLQLAAVFELHQIAESMPEVYERAACLAQLDPLPVRAPHGLDTVAAGGRDAREGGRVDVLVLCEERAYIAIAPPHFARHAGGALAAHAHHIAYKIARCHIPPNYNVYLRFQYTVNATG